MTMDERIQKGIDLILSGLLIALVALDTREGYIYKSPLVNEIKDYLGYYRQ